MIHIFIAFLKHFMMRCIIFYKLIDCVQRFFSWHHVGKLLVKCNGMKEKGVSPVSLLRYKLSNIFVGRSMYMQQRTGSVLEMADITFSRLLGILMDALMASLQEILKLSDEQLIALIYLYHRNIFVCTRKSFSQ